ncbi:MAG: DNA-processing protein DprA [bacterium]|nr:DNA-processing protein DprA [bacterium]
MAEKNSEQEKIYANALNQCLKIGPASLGKIRKRFRSFKKAWGAPIGELAKTTEIKNLEEFRKNIVPEKEFEILVKNEIKVLLKKELPNLLQETSVPPEILYIKGRLPQEGIHLAVVGTRKCSNYGREACEKIVNELKEYGVVIVSGLALGIDTIAHKAALKNKMKTVAVLGSGLKNSVIYPGINQRLAQEIIEKDGCLISEYPFDMKAARFTFPQRNRIVAGMSAGTLVVEAPERSGALITALMALEYNREVFAVPGSIFSQLSKGANNLLKMGAAIVTETEDVLRALGIEPKEKNGEINLSPLELKIVEFLYEPSERDELIRKSKIPTKDALPLLIQMEIKGILKESGGKIYKL